VSQLDRCRIIEEAFGLGGATLRHAAWRVGYGVGAY